LPAANTRSVPNGTSSPATAIHRSVHPRPCAK
jgi:hypothetical protein